VLSGALLFTPGPAQAAVPGTVVAWGCGNGADLGQCSVPSSLAGHVTAIAGGAFQSLGLTEDGRVIAWGCSFEDFGQCTVPAEATSSVTAVAAGDWDSLALKQDGSVLAWGCGSDTDFGQCTVPAAASSGVTAIAAGTLHSLALKQDGSVIAWGCGGGADFGQCTVPAAASSGVTAIAASLRHSLALKQDGSVLTWGCGDVDYGQCTVPAAASSVTAIAAGESHSLALKQDGSVIAWGCGSDGGISRDFGQCNVPGSVCDAIAISAGAFHSLALLEKVCQTITFGVLANKTYGTPDFNVNANASSGLPVSFAASGNCTVSGAIVHLTGAGSCTVTASQPGDAIYNPAADVSQRFVIAKASQSISFGPLAGKTYGDLDLAVSATASSGLAVSFAASGTCTVSGPTTVHLAGAGSCTVTASQSGNANYKPAATVSRTFAIAKAGQTISFGPLANKTYGAPDFDVSAGASSGAGLLRGERKVHGRGGDRAPDGSRFVHGDRLAAGQRELQPRARRLAELFDQAPAVQGAEGCRETAWGRQEADREEALSHRQGGPRLLAQAQEGHRHLPEPQARTGAAGQHEDQPRRQSRSQALGTLTQ
jgi:hypothetical protein